MGKFYDEIPESHFKWIKKQNMFFVATAPLTEQGHVNLSPKGTADCFHVVDSKQVWYQDLTGSGVETISHIRENGRITIMFCAFEGPPRILRLFGTGTIHEYGSPEYNRLIPATSRKPGSRAAIVIDIYQVGTSCGYSVPLYDFVMHRTQLERVADKFESGDRALAAASNGEHDPAPSTEHGSDTGSKPSLRAYWLFKNMTSLDGLPGLTTAPEAMLSVVPQNNFDPNGPRPMLRRDKPTSDTTRDLTWFVSGCALGATAAFVYGRYMRSLRG